MTQPSCTVFIPARFASQRLPGKMLRQIAGKPLIQWTYENACRAFPSRDIWILTDHSDIYQIARRFGANVLMTPENCENGSARIQWALQHDLCDISSDYIIGLQGDEPLLAPQAMIDTLQAITVDPQAVMSTLVAPLDISDFENPSVVKCVYTTQHKALYFSRSPIPNPGWHKQHHSLPPLAKRHIGLYVWRHTFIKKTFYELPVSELQRTEDLEQLRILEAGLTIRIALWPEKLAPGVDIEEDIARVEALLLGTPR